MNQMVFGLVCVCVALFAVPVRADFFEPLVTNWSSATENDPYYPTYPFHYGNQPSLADISGGYYAWGTAFEFNLDESWHINGIASPIDVIAGRDGHTPVPGTWRMNLSLYKGSTGQFRGQPLPNGQVIPLTANPLVNDYFTARGNDLLSYSPPNTRTYSFQGLDDLDLTLDPGTYWAAYYDGSVVSYVQPRVRLSGAPVAAVPEPATVLLLAGGLLGLGWRRRA